MSEIATPDTATIVSAREAAQEALGLRITDAQDWCAQAIHVQRRTWQYYESGRAIPLGLWELLAIKLARRGVRIAGVELE